MRTVRWYMWYVGHLVRWYVWYVGHVTNRKHSGSVARGRAVGLLSFSVCCIDCVLVVGLSIRRWLGSGASVLAPSDATPLSSMSLQTQRSH